MSNWMSFLRKLFSILAAQRAQIPDYSYWNNEVDWAKAKANGAAGALLRSSWGCYPDTKFEHFRNGCEAIGLPWGAYHYYDFRWSLAENLAAQQNALGGRFGKINQVGDFEQDPSNYPLKAIRAIAPGESPEEALDV